MKEYAWLPKQRVAKIVHAAIKKEADREHRKITEQVEYILTRWYEGKQK